MLSKERLKDIVDNVAVKIYREVESNDEISDALKSVILESPTSLIAKFCSIPFYNDDKLNEKVDELKELFSVMQQEEIEIILDCLSRIVQLYMEWAENEGIEIELSVFDELLSYTKDSDDDLFFDFDSDFTDENIEHMHYSDEDKINAEEFLGVYNREELEEIEDRVHGLLDYCAENCTDPTFSREYLENMMDFLGMFKDFFDDFEEFKDLSYSLSKLENKISTIDIDMFDDSQKLILHDLFEKVYVDLDDWARNVIFSRTAVDIHYIDASLTANVDQIEIIINYMNDTKDETSDEKNEIEGTEEDGEIEFF